MVSIVARQCLTMNNACPLHGASAMSRSGDMTERLCLPGLHRHCLWSQALTRRFERAHWKATPMLALQGYPNKMAGALQSQPLPNGGTQPRLIEGIKM